MMDKRVQWVVQELKVQLVEQGYIVYINESSTGSVYITLDLGLGSKIRVSNHSSVKSDIKSDILVQPEVPKNNRDPDKIYFKLHRDIDIIDNILLTIASQKVNTEKKLGYLRYIKLLKSRGLDNSVIFRDLLELCEMHGKRLYKSILSERIKNNRDIQSLRNIKFFYKK